MIQFLREFMLGECAGIHSVGRSWKRWTDTMKDCLRKKRFGCEASKKNSVVQDRSEWWGFVRGNAGDVA